MLTLDLEDARWRQLVATHPRAGPFHHPAWARTIADVYRFRPFVAAVEDAKGTLAAGIPVIEVPAFPRGRRWVSLPFTDHCAPLASSPAALSELVGSVGSVPPADGLRRVEIRSAVPNAPNHPVAVLHELRLSGDPTELFARFHASQIRRGIRKAERDGRVRVREATRREDVTKSFLELHLQTRRRQGVPLQPMRLFELLWQRLHPTGLARTLIAELDGRPIAAAMFLRFGGTVVYKYGASAPEHWRERPNHLIFWRAIQDACAAGDRCLDLGRSDPDNAGLRAFKSNWAAQERPLLYTAIPASAPAGRGAPQNVGRRVLSTTIRRSPPVVCRALGAVLYRYAA